MNQPEPFIDIHCHILPGLDDGPAAWEESLEMAETAAADGIVAIVATPHQLGNYPHITAEKVRIQIARLQSMLEHRGVGLELLPGADVRIDPDLTGKILSGQVLTLADRRTHVLLELPHELYIPLDRLLGDLHSAGLTGILSHPERNQGIINQPKVLSNLVNQGCLLQVTAGSLTGVFGSRIQNFAESMVERGFADFIASDAHGIKYRTPHLSRAFDRVVKLAGYETAIELFCRNPARVHAGMPVTPHAPQYKNHKSYCGNSLLNTARQFVHF
ncbi:MAG: CpsB/CapC family capsule biosynthesis tyrosine phosphatase [Thermoguttaceae bacterium]